MCGSISASPRLSVSRGENTYGKKIDTRRRRREESTGNSRDDPLGRGLRRHDRELRRGGDEVCRGRRFDLVLTDLKMTGMSGLDLLKELTNYDKSIIVILLTAHGSVDSAVDALRLGAFDYLQKPYDSEKLLETVSRALNKLSALDTEIVSVSPEMDKVKKLILKIAKSNSTVLIRGESGTGKELIARSIHKNSLALKRSFSGSELCGDQREPARIGTVRSRKRIVHRCGRRQKRTVRDRRQRNAFSG